MSKKIRAEGYTCEKNSCTSNGRKSPTPVRPLDASLELMFFNKRSATRTTTVLYTPIEKESKKIIFSVTLSHLKL